MPLGKVFWNLVKKIVKLQADNALIQMGVQRRKKLNDELAILTKKRAKLRKQTE